MIIKTTCHAPARLLFKAEFPRSLVKADFLRPFILTMVMCLLTKGERLVKRRENSSSEQGDETSHSWAVGHSALSANSHFIYSDTSGGSESFKLPRAPQMGDFVQRCELV